MPQGATYRPSLMGRKKKRILVLTKPKDADDPGAGLHPLGSPGDVRAAAERFNTSADGGDAKRAGTVILHGPGFTLEYSLSQDAINQAMVVVHDTDFAWPVLSKLCRAMDWKMQDTDTGQIFG